MYLCDSYEKIYLTTSFPSAMCALIQFTSSGNRIYRKRKESFREE